jgi:hypothetical protein
MSINVKIRIYKTIIFPVGKKRNACRILVRKLEGRPGCRWVDNIEMDLREIGCGGMDWIDLAQYMSQWRTFLNVVVNPQVRPRHSSGG